MPEPLQKGFQLDREAVVRELERKARSNLC